MANGTITLDMLYEAINKLAQKIEELDLEVHELREEREVRPEYIEKLKRIEKEQGIKFNTKEELFEYLDNLGK